MARMFHNVIVNKYATWHMIDLLAETSRTVDIDHHLRTLLAQLEGASTHSLYNSRFAFPIASWPPIAARQPLLSCHVPNTVSKISSVHRPVSCTHGQAAVLLRVPTRQQWQREQSASSTKFLSYTFLQRVPSLGLLKSQSKLAQDVLSVSWITVKFKTWTFLGMNDAQHSMEECTL